MTVFTTDGRVLFLDVLLGDQPPLILEVGLFTNNITPLVSTLLSGLVEPLGDYSRATTSNWSRQQITEPPIQKSDQVEFVITGWTGTVYGYFFAVGDRLIAVETFDIPFNISGTTQSLGVIPKLSLSNQS